MEKFIPFEKLSKKKRKDLNNAKRVLWNVKPVTTKINSKKIYKRLNKEWLDEGIV